MLAASSPFSSGQSSHFNQIIATTRHRKSSQLRHCRFRSSARLATRGGNDLRCAHLLPFQQFPAQRARVRLRRRSPRGLHIVHRAAVDSVRRPAVS